ncbi:MAG: metallophosphoesterase family protein, partial [Bacteroidetes bacterium]|nr:metallophosphoesterase family protein [Bacteroidota bacterium]
MLLRHTGVKSLPRWISYYPTRGLLFNRAKTAIVAVSIIAYCLWSKATSRFTYITCFWLVLILSGLPAVNCFAQSVSVTRGPYLQVGTPNSMVVRWRTDSLTPVNSRVYYCIQPDSVVIVDETSLTTEHEVKITGLSPNTRYYYGIATSDSILTGPDSMQYFQTSPLPGTEQLIRVWAIGDFGEGNNGQRAVRDAYKNFLGNKHTDVWLWLGDNAYDDGRDFEYQTNTFDMYPSIYAKTVLWPSPGNHDYGSTYPFDSIGPDPYFNNFTMPANGEAGGTPSGTESFYSFNYGNVHFISLSSEDYAWSGIFPDFTVTHSAAMITWLENDLAANTNKDWIIAYWHATPYSEGTHSENYSGPDIIKKIDGLAMRSMRDYLAPILENYGVDLIICGHSHNYERSYLIHGFYGSDSPYLADSIKVDTLSGNIPPYIKYSTGPNPNLGTVYTVVGSSAKTGNFGSDGQLDHPLMYTGDY